MKSLILFSALSVATSSVATKPAPQPKPGPTKIGTALRQYKEPMLLVQCDKGKTFSLLVAGVPNSNGRQAFLFKCDNGVLVVPGSVWPIRP